MPKNDPIYQRCYMRLKRKFGHVSQKALKECIHSETMKEGENRFFKPVKTVFVRVPSKEEQNELIEGLKTDFWDKEQPKETTLERETRVSKLAEGSAIDYKLLLKLLEDDES